jgi:hypothetical protein
MTVALRPPRVRRPLLQLLQLPTAPIMQGASAFPNWNQSLAPRIRFWRKFSLQHIAQRQLSRLLKLNGQNPVASHFQMGGNAFPLMDVFQSLGSRFN